VERYGPDQNTVDLRLILAAGCPKIAANQIMDLCGVYYPDRIARGLSRRIAAGKIGDLRSLPI